MTLRGNDLIGWNAVNLFQFCLVAFDANGHIVMVRQGVYEEGVVLKQFNSEKSGRDMMLQLEFRPEIENQLADDIFNIPAEVWNDPRFLFLKNPDDLHEEGFQSFSGCRDRWDNRDTQEFRKLLDVDLNSFSL